MRSKRWINRSLYLVPLYMRIDSVITRSNGHIKIYRSCEGTTLWIMGYLAPWGAGECGAKWDTLVYLFINSFIGLFSIYLFITKLVSKTLRFFTINSPFDCEGRLCDTLKIPTPIGTFHQANHSKPEPKYFVFQSKETNPVITRQKHYFSKHLVFEGGPRVGETTISGRARLRLRRPYAHYIRACIHLGHHCVGASQRLWIASKFKATELQPSGRFTRCSFNAAFINPAGAEELTISSEPRYRIRVPLTGPTSDAY